MLRNVIKAIERTAWLDPVAERVAGAVSAATKPRPVKNALSGTWLGHPLHPLLTDLPIGSFTSAMTLDLIGGRRSQGAADLLVAAGILSAVPTAASGLSDWAETYGEDRRVGLVHAAANVVGLGLYGASLRARAKGRRGQGVTLGLLGGTALTVGGYLGGHLSYASGVGVDHTAFTQRPSDWTAVLNDDELSDGRAHRATAGGVGVLLVRAEGRILALDDRCTHAGGPLHEGTLDDTCVTCPWHGSTFRLESGAVVRGPATSDQTVWEARVRDGRIEVRPAQD